MTVYSLAVEGAKNFIKEFLDKILPPKHVVSTVPKKDLVIT